MTNILAFYTKFQFAIVKIFIAKATESQCEEASDSKANFIKKSTVVSCGLFLGRVSRSLLAKTFYAPCPKIF